MARLVNWSWQEYEEDLWQQNVTVQPTRDTEQGSYPSLWNMQCDNTACDVKACSQDGRYFGEGWGRPGLQWVAEGQGAFVLLGRSCSLWRGTVGTVHCISFKNNHLCPWLHWACRGDMTHRCYYCHLLFGLKTAVIIGKDICALGIRHTLHIALHKPMCHCYFSLHF